MKRPKSKATSRRAEDHTGTNLGYYNPVLKNSWKYQSTNFALKTFGQQLPIAIEEEVNIDKKILKGPPIQTP